MNETNRGLSPVVLAAGAAAGGATQSLITSGSLDGWGDNALSMALFTGAGLVGAEASALRVAAHAAAGCVSASAAGGDCRSGALSAGFSKVGTIAFNGYGNDFKGFVASTVIGGTASVIGGGKFANGASTAAFGYLFNYCAHNGCFERQFKYADAFAQGQLGGGATVTDVDPLTLQWSQANLTYDSVSNTYYANWNPVGSQTGLVFGGIGGITLSADGVISIPNDRYNFDQKNPFTDTRGFWTTLARDVLTIGGRIAQGPRYTPFDISFRQGVRLPDDLRTRFEALRSPK